MKFQRLCGSLLGASLLLVGTLNAQLRQWTSSDGRTLQAAFVSAHEDRVTVRKGNGSLVDIPLEKLSEQDREFAAQKFEEARLAAIAKNEELKKEQLELKKEKLLKGPFTYKLSDGHEDWPEDRKKRIVEAMDAAVMYMNEHGKFKKHVWANNSPGTPTATANYEGWINWGGSISRRVALHEFSHTLGIGTHPDWQKNIKDGKWTGKHAIAQLKEFDGEDAVLHADHQHFWPYGLNYDNGSCEVKDLRFIKMLEAFRKDMGIR